MKILHTVKNYLFYCGIEKDEYNAIKKDAYVSNFRVWRVLHCLMATVLAFMYISSLKVGFISANRPFYLGAFVYSVIAAALFLFVLKKDSIAAQLLIYLSISVLYLFACFITRTKPESPATSFIAFLLIAPMFMIDKPYFMGIELSAASVIYLVWMYNVKAMEVWEVDLGNVIVFSVVGFFLHVIANSIRIKEFVLSRQLMIQKDTDDMTGLKNKGAITREINAYLADGANDKGLMFLLDIDNFKSINDTYGHDVGDSVINQLGVFLGKEFKGDASTGRFGGDEFIVFIKNTGEKAVAEKAAKRMIEGAAESVRLPDKDRVVGVSVGIAVWGGKEKNYSEIFKKADVALYKTKADRTVKYAFYNEDNKE